MKVKCPVCGIEGFLQIRGSSARIQHYKGFINGKRKYEYHKIPKSLLPSIMEVNGSKNSEVKTLNLGFNQEKNGPVVQSGMNAALALHSINWDLYRQWLLSRYPRRSALDRLNYAKKYYQCLLRRDLSSLQMLPDDKRVHAMKGLAAISKFLGIYSEWKDLVKRFDLKWSSRSSLRSFLSILSYNLNDSKKWLFNIIQKIPMKYKVYLSFLALTGVRAIEGERSLNLILSLNERNQLNQYYDEELSMLRHFAYPELFIHGSKNLFISFIDKDFLNIILDKGSRITHAGLISYVNRAGYNCRANELRKMFATTLRDEGLPSELIDLLQGRLSGSIFKAFYYKPILSEIREKVERALEPLRNEILSYF